MFSCVCFVVWLRYRYSDLSFKVSHDLFYTLICLAFVLIPLLWSPYFWTFDMILWYEPWLWSFDLNLIMNLAMISETSDMNLWYEPYGMNLLIWYSDIRYVIWFPFWYSSQICFFFGKGQNDLVNILTKKTLKYNGYGWHPISQPFT